MRKIKKNDDVIIVAGKDKGVRGSVLRVLEDKLLVSGVNKVKKHQKPNPVKGVSGGIVEMEMPMQNLDKQLGLPQHLLTLCPVRPHGIGIVILQ